MVQSNLDQVHQREFEEYSKRCWQKGKHHFMARFTVKVIISPADLKFEASILPPFKCVLSVTNALPRSCGLKECAIRGVMIRLKSNGMLLALLRGRLRMMGVVGRGDDGSAICNIDAVRTTAGN